MTQRFAHATGAPPAGRDRAAIAAGALAALGGAVVGVGTYLLFVRTRDGQRVDQAALARVNGGDGPSEQIATVLSDLTIGVALAVLLGCVVVALVQRRVGDAVAAAVLVAGANVTTQLAKNELLERPSLGFGPTNTLPSGHTTLACSLLLAVLIVAPRISRGSVVLLASGATCAVGLGTVIAGWHRPSDVLAALGVCLLWAGLIAVVRTRGVGLSRSPAYVSAALLGAGAAVVVAVVYGAHPEPTTVDVAAHAVTLAAIAVVTAGTFSLVARTLPARTTAAAGR